MANTYSISPASISGEAFVGRVSTILHNVAPLLDTAFGALPSDLQLGAPLFPTADAAYLSIILRELELRNTSAATLEVCVGDHIHSTFFHANLSPGEVVSLRNCNVPLIHGAPGAVWIRSASADPADGTGAKVRYVGYALPHVEMPAASAAFARGVIASYLQASDRFWTLGATPGAYVRAPDAVTDRNVLPFLDGAVLNGYDGVVLLNALRTRYGTRFTLPAATWYAKFARSGGPLTFNVGAEWGVDAGASVTVASSPSVYSSGTLTNLPASRYPLPPVTIYWREVVWLGDKAFASQWTRTPFNPASGFTYTLAGPLDIAPAERWPVRVVGSGDFPATVGDGVPVILELFIADEARGLLTSVTRFLLGETQV